MHTLTPELARRPRLSLATLCTGVFLMLVYSYFHKPAMKSVADDATVGATSSS